MVGERRTDLRGPTSTLDIGKYDKLIFSVMLWEYHFCLLGNNDGGESNLHATLYDESQQTNEVVMEAALGGAWLNRTPWQVSRTGVNGSNPGYIFNLVSIIEPPSPLLIGIDATSVPCGLNVIQQVTNK